MRTTRLNLDGKTVLITGAAGGIGAAVATALADRGSNVVVTDLSQAALDTATARIPRDRLLAVAANVTDARSSGEKPASEI
jgi:NAD(P)-dependent dehydrogenase (short-subunit alcohol dehydrogenase family)